MSNLSYCLYYISSLELLPEDVEIAVATVVIEKVVEAPVFAAEKMVVVVVDVIILLVAVCRNITVALVVRNSNSG